MLNMKDVYAGQYSFIRGERGVGDVILARNVMCLLAWVPGCLCSLVSTPYGIVMQNNDHGDLGRGEHTLGALESIKFQTIPSSDVFWNRM